jgi:hypothetical protein
MDVELRLQPRPAATMCFGDKESKKDAFDWLVNVGIAWALLKLGCQASLFYEQDAC